MEDNIIVARGNTADKEPTPSNTANRSSSVLSDAPLTDEGEGQSTVGATQDDGPSAETVNGVSHNAQGEQNGDFATPTRGGMGVGRGRGGGRPRGKGKGGGLAGSGLLSNGGTPDGSTQTPTPGKARGRGRGGGRPRGKGKGSARSNKRKRDDDDEDSDSASSISSDEVTPIATMTKSGRSVQKPTSFVPPPPASPMAPATKRKRVFTRRNPESAVCKVCLRGTSPTSNMIVFCDGCNSPYHRYCHQPAIDQSVIDVVDKEWFCRRCEVEREVPVPEGEISGFVAVEGVGAEQRQQYFSSLPSGLLVTLLTKATTLQPTLPVFAPDFAARILHPTSTANPTAPPTNGVPPKPPSPKRLPPYSYHPPPRPNGVRAPDPPTESYYGPDVHPRNYPRPGQGLMKTLPQDREEEGRLVEEDRFGVFTHFWKPDERIEEAAKAAGPGNGGSGGAGASANGGAGGGGDTTAGAAAPTNGGASAAGPTSHPGATVNGGGGSGGLKGSVGLNFARDVPASRRLSRTLPRKLSRFTSSRLHLSTETVPTTTINPVMATEAMDTEPDIPTESLPDEKIIDDGDLLIDCCDKSGGKFLVSSATIKRVSPVFKAMLGPHFKEGQSKTLPLEVECPEDDWAGMRLMLQLLHNCASCVDGEIPKREALECFTDMAILADKYQSTDRNRLYCLAVAAYLLKKSKHFYVFTKRLVLEQTKLFHNIHERYVPGIGDVLGFRFILELETQRTAAILSVSEEVRDMAKAGCPLPGCREEIISDTFLTLLRDELDLEFPWPPTFGPHGESVGQVLRGIKSAGPVEVGTLACRHGNRSPTVTKHAYQFKSFAAKAYESLGGMCIDCVKKGCYKTGVCKEVGHATFHKSNECEL
ncbi:unnamed protein product [Zymoseptoria tritici ST99CH_3D1]|nr:unnamed protein product [Zymoseptoria tritici ST99CH_3D1]